jgi:methionine synthase I (cobalamin-dependent)
MEDKKEVRRLFGLARKIVTKSTYKKLKELRAEREEAIKYAIKARLENVLDYFEKRIKLLKKEGKETFIAETKLHTLKGKVRLFNATHHKKELDSIRKLVKEIQKEMKNG